MEAQKQPSECINQLLEYNRAIIKESRKICKQMIVVEPDNFDSKLEYLEIIKKIWDHVENLTNNLVELDKDIVMLMIKVTVEEDS